MPTLARVRNVVDAELADLWQNQIVPRQDIYFANHGKYWQGLRTGLITAMPDNPDDGTTTVVRIAPLVDTHPTDQDETWVGAGIDLGVSVPMILQIDVYDGPLGKGYVGTVWAAWDGNVYTRSQNRGPESWRTEDWRRLNSEEVADLLVDF